MVAVTPKPPGTVRNTLDQYDKMILLVNWETVLACIYDQGIRFIGISRQNRIFRAVGLRKLNPE